MTPYTRRVIEALTPVRVELLLLVGRGEKTIGAISAEAGLSPSTVSKHLAILQDARLVRSSRDGREVYVRLAVAGVELRFKP
jgi:DNA-binding transcriptional ArsR family regulator